MRVDLKVSMHSPAALKFAILCAAVMMLAGLGAEPAEVAPFAYVANQDDNTVSAIDSASNKVVATIPVGVGPSAVFVSPYGNRVFVRVAGMTGPALSIIDTAANKVEATLPGFFGSFSPDGTRAYLTNGDNVEIFDFATNKVVATIPIPTPFPPFLSFRPSAESPVATPDGTRVFVLSVDTFCANPNDCVTKGRQSEIKTATNAVIDFGIAPGLQLDSVDWKNIYFSVSSALSLDSTALAGVEDYSTGTVVAMFGVNYCPSAGTFRKGAGTVISPDATHFWVTCFGEDGRANYIKVAKTGADGSITTLARLPESDPLVFIPKSRRAYIVGHPESGGPTTFYAIDTSNLSTAVSYALKGPPNVTGLAVTPDGKQLYVVQYNPGNTSLNTVEAISTATNEVVARIQTGKGPFTIAIMPYLPLSAFSSKLAISLDPKSPYFELLSNITLGSGAAYLDPPAEPITVQVGTFGATIPPGSFTGNVSGGWTFDGTVNGTPIHAKIWLTGTKQYLVLVKAMTAVTGAANPVTTRLTLLNNSATAPVTAAIYK